MQNRLLLSCVLLGTLFIALPTITQAQAYRVTVKDVNSAGLFSKGSSDLVTAGALLNGDNTMIYDGSNFVTVKSVDSDYSVPDSNFTANTYTISLNPINAGALTTNNLPAAAVVSADITGVHNLISAIEFSAGLDATAFGFLLYDMNGSATSFGGTIGNGWGIKVSNNGTDQQSDAIGLGFFAQNATDPLALDSVSIDLGLIEAYSNKGDGFGFFSKGIMDSKILLDGIKVESDQVADGMHIEAETSRVSGNINIGTEGITVTSKSGDARGLFINATDQSINAHVVVSGNVVVNGAADLDSDDTSAIGLQFAGNILADKRIIATGDIIVTAANNHAIGVDFQGTINSTIAPTFGKIAVTVDEDATTGNAIGISAQNANSVITLTKDITATSTAGDAYGVVFLAGGTVNIQENVSITATGKSDSVDSYALNAKDKLILNVDPNKNLMANRVAVTEGDLTVSGGGRADLALVKYAKKTVLNNNTILAVDGVQMTEKSGWLGDEVQFNPGSRLVIYGDTKSTNSIGGTTNAQPGQIVNMAQITEWGYDESTNRIKAMGTRKQVFANDNYLAASQIHQKYTGLHAVKDHVISGAVLSAPQYDYYGQSNSKYYKPRGAWVNYIGRDSHYRSSYAPNRTDWDFGTNGVQVGTDIWRTNRHQFGAFFGYEGTTGNNLADRLEASDYYVGLYGVHVFNTGTDLRAVFNYGWQNFDTCRRDLNGIFNTSSFDGNSAELNVELGKRRYFGNWSARPVIGIDWHLTQLGGAQETGGINAFRYSSTDLSQLFFRFGSDLRYEWQRVAIEGGLYYSYDMLGDTLQSGAVLLETGQSSTLVGSKLGRSVLTLNLGGSWTVYRNFSLFGGYRAEVTPERSGDGYAHTGYVGGAWRW